MTARRLALAAAFALFPLSGLAEPLDYTVPGTVPLIRQDSPNVGWSALATMMESWKAGRALAVKEVMEKTGTVGGWRSQKEHLRLADKKKFLTNLSLKAEPPRSYTVEEWEQLLRNSGPLWITTADGERWFSEHGWLVVGLKGDGTPDGTVVRFIDPADGEMHETSFAQFIDLVAATARQDLGNSTGGQPQVVIY
jgi:Papain-like cysteine protease AvrRpt2